MEAVARSASVPANYRLSPRGGRAQSSSAAAARARGSHRCFRFCYVFVCSVHTRTTATQTGASSSTLSTRSIKPHRRDGRTRECARVCSIRFFTRSDWPPLHGAVRQSDRVVDKLTPIYTLTSDRDAPFRFYCFLNFTASIPRRGRATPLSQLLYLTN